MILPPLHSNVFVCSYTFKLRLSYICPYIIQCRLSRAIHRPLFISSATFICPQQHHQVGWTFLSGGPRMSPRRGEANSPYLYPPLPSPLPSTGSLDNW